MVFPRIFLLLLMNFIDDFYSIFPGVPLFLSCFWGLLLVLQWKCKSKDLNPRWGVVHMGQVMREGRWNVGILLLRTGIFHQQKGIANHKSNIDMGIYSVIPILPTSIWICPKMAISTMKMMTYGERSYFQTQIDPQRSEDLKIWRFSAKKCSAIRRVSCSWADGITFSRWTHVYRSWQFGGNMEVSSSQKWGIPRMAGAFHGKSNWNRLFGGTPISGNPHMDPYGLLISRYSGRKSDSYRE